MTSIRKDSVETFPGLVPSTEITDELIRLRSMVHEICPPDAMICFDFDDRLHLHIDVRNQVDVALIEARLPTLGSGLFYAITHGSTPHHRFFHRVSALVAR